jgi:hypothetical protein
MTCSNISEASFSKIEPQKRETAFSLWLSLFLFFAFNRLLDLLHHQPVLAIVVIALPDIDGVITFLFVQSDRALVGHAHRQPHARSLELTLGGTQHGPPDAALLIIGIHADIPGRASIDFSVEGSYNQSTVSEMSRELSLFRNHRMSEKYRSEVTLL